VKGNCILAGESHSESYLCRLRKQVYESQHRKKTHGFKLVAGCGNPRCIAFAHIQQQPWKMFGRTWTKREPSGGLGDVISDMRRLTGLNQIQFGQLLGVTQGAVSNWESGKDKPSFEMLSRLVELSDVPTAIRLVDHSGLNHFMDTFNKKVSGRN
jgi:DNA-binding transcriptional regulator YiaG